MEAFAHCNQSKQRAGRQEFASFPGPGALQHCQPGPEPSSRTSLSIPGEAPDRKGQVSWKAPLGLDPLPPQGGPTLKNEHLLLGPLGK